MLRKPIKNDIIISKEYGDYRSSLTIAESKYFIKRNNEQNKQTTSNPRFNPYLASMYADERP
jgi:hypothetical protein